MRIAGRLFDKLKPGRTRIRTQMYGIYTLALLIPLSILGVSLLISANRMFNEHFIELLEADNRRVRTLLSEVTTQAYTVSDDFIYDQTLKRLLMQEYESSVDFIAEVNKFDKLDTQAYNTPEIEGIYIYTDNPSICDYKQFRCVTEEIGEGQWYQQALSSGNAFWVSIPEESYSNENSNLCLVRRLALSETRYNAVIVTKISDSYIRSRIDSSSIVDAVSVDEQGIAYSSKRGWYGEAQVVEIDHSQDYYRYSGEVKVEDVRYFACVTTLHLHRTNSKMYICTLDASGFSSIASIMRYLLVLLFLAVMVPGVILAVFANHFSGRVRLLRKEMHKARSQDYNIISDFSGNDELTEAFEDLKVMVQDIKEKDAKMYEAELNEKELRNSQQKMEYKMLASQINPHYLYNTLETIRMKALTSGNREVADSVKILGKTLHYVQENTGTAFTTLKKELEHVENYLAIQKLRFGDRINHSLEIQPGVDPEGYRMLPLLLQPVVENAVVHGLEVLDGTGLVRIEVHSDGTLLQIAVSDNGKGMSLSEVQGLRNMLEQEEVNSNTGIALYNIHRRIRLCYGEGFGLKLESVLGQGTTVTLILPADAANIWL